MFNRSAFNDLQFNQPNDEVIISAVLNGSAGLNAHTTASMTGGANLSAQANLAATMSRIYDARIHVSATSSLRSQFMLLRALKSQLSARSSIIATESKYQVRRLVFTGNVPVGGAIEIDANKMELTLNGENALRHMNGHFSVLSTGMNQVIYTDHGAQRTVFMQVIHKDANI